MRTNPPKTARAAALAAAVAVVAPARAAELAPEAGYQYGETETAKTLALGGAVRAFGTSTLAIFTNPANMAAARVYHLEALAGFIPEAKRQTYGAAAVDSVINPAGLAGGLGFTYGVLDPDGLGRKWSDLRVGLAYPFSNKVFAGAVGRYVRLKQEGLGPLGASRASGGLADEAIVNAVTFDAGITFRPSETVALALVGQNLSNPGHGLLPTVLGGGLGIAAGDLTIEGDAFADLDTWRKTTARAMGGLSYLAGDHYPIRVGYRYDAGARTHAVSGGLGYIDTTMGIEVGLRRTVAGPSDRTMWPTTAFTISAQFFLESTGLTPAPSEGF